MTEWHSGSSTSNSPFQTQLPHICTPAASPGNPRKCWNGCPKKKKAALSLAAQVAEHLRVGV